MRPSQDIADYIEQEGYGERNRDLYTSAEKGAYDQKALNIIVKDIQSSKAADVTINADYINVNIKVSGNYNQNGEDHVRDKAEQIYRLLRLKHDIDINGTHYYYVMALTPPIHSGFDTETGVSTYEFNCETMRSLKEA